jgi:carbonic anhydrase/acetyltransferase-like protein (isoleucine patch superfamily)
MIIKYGSHTPQIHKRAYVDLTAYVIGDVTIGEESSVWFGAVIRGDINRIRIGKFTNIQDGCVLHVSENEGYLEIGDHVTVGHRAILHACKVESYCLIGMGAVVLDGAVVGPESIVGAGAVVTKGTVVPKRALVVGVPAKPIREVGDEDIEEIRSSANGYVQLKENYLKPDEEKFNVRGFGS